MHVAVLLFCMCVTARGQGDTKGKVKDNDFSLWLYSKEKPQMIQNGGLKVQLSFAFSCHGSPNIELACLATAVSRSSFNVTSLLFKKLLSKGQKNKCWWGCGKKQTLEQDSQDYMLVSPLWEQTSQILRVELPCYLAILLWHLFLKEMKSAWLENIWTPMLRAAVFRVLEMESQPNVIDVWLDKENMLYM